MKESHVKGPSHVNYEEKGRRYARPIISDKSFQPTKTYSAQSTWNQIGFRFKYCFPNRIKPVELASANHLLVAPVGASTRASASKRPFDSPRRCVARSKRKASPQERFDEATFFGCVSWKGTLQNGTVGTSLCFPYTTKQCPLKKDRPTWVRKLLSKPATMKYKQCSNVMGSQAKGHQNGQMRSIRFWTWASTILFDIGLGCRCRLSGKDPRTEGNHAEKP